MATQLITPKFQLGDCVKLSSGTQNMSITWLYTQAKLSNINAKDFTGFVECSWFDGLQLQQKKFHQDALIKANPSDTVEGNSDVLMIKTLNIKKE